LTAAVLFGLVGGVAFLLVGLVAVVLGVPVGDSLSSITWASPPWWLTMLILIGQAGIIGGAIARWRAAHAGVIMWLASATAIVIGLVSVNQVLALIADSPLTLSGWQWLVFVALVAYFVGALFALMLGGTLALLGHRKAVHADTASRTAKAKATHAAAPGALR